MKKKVLNTDIYCITAEEYSNGKTNIQIVEELIEAGIKIIQYREKEKNMLDKYQECVKIRQMTKQADVCFIVNDDIDLGMIVNADGIHIGQNDLPVEQVRKLVGNDMIIGLSTHAPIEAQNAVKMGVDYIGVGPIFKTNTKKDVCDPVGLEYLKYVSENVNIPFVAIGGIKEHNLYQIVAHGGKCVAMITEIVSADNIKEKISNIRKIMTQG